MTEEEKRRQAAAVEQGQQPDRNVTPTPPTPNTEEGDGITSFTVKGGDGQTYTNRATADGGRETVDEKGNVVNRTNADGTQWNAPESKAGQKSTVQPAGTEPAKSQLPTENAAEPTQETEETPTATADDALDELERENEERLRKGKEIYESMFRPTETEAERNQREKREKTLRIVAGIHDMTRALANLYGTVRYAPSWYDGNNLSDKAKERYERAKTEREKDKAYNDNLRMVLNKLEGDYNNMKLKIEAEKARRAEAAANRAMRERLAKAAAEAKESDSKRKDDELEERKRHNKEVEKTARQNANRPRGGGGSGSGKNTFTFYSPSGKSQLTMPPNKATTISVVYDMMDEDHKLDYGEKTPTPNQMWTLINAYLNDTTVDEALRIAAWNKLVSIYKATEEPKEINKGKGGGSSKSQIDIFKKKK